MTTKLQMIDEQPSTSAGHEVMEEDNYVFMHFYEQQDIRGGLHICFKFWKKCRLLKDQQVTQSHKATALGDKFVMVIIEILKEWDLNWDNEEEELFLPEESIPGDVTDKQCF